VGSSFEPSVLGAHSHGLPRGPRVRLRLVQFRDEREIRAFLADHGRPAPDLEAARLTRSDPQRCVAISATALVGGTETIVGVGAIEVGADEPDLLVIDPRLTEGLDELLSQALWKRAETIASRRAA
jgi:hypothetical protein